MTPLTSAERTALINTLTEYDKNELVKHCKNAKRPYNVFALGLYMEALERASNAINCGTSRREALVDAFCGKLLDKVLKTLNMDKSTDAEQRCNF
jgi:hypothetical protein